MTLNDIYSRSGGMLFNDLYKPLFAEIFPESEKHMKEDPTFLRFRANYDKALIPSILRECGDFNVLYNDCLRFAEEIKNWSWSRAGIWNDLFRTTIQYYNLIHNTDKNEEHTDTRIVEERIVNNKDGSTEVKAKISGNDSAENESRSVNSSSASSSAENESKSVNSSSASSSAENESKSVNSSNTSSSAKSTSENDGRSTEDSSNEANEENYVSAYDSREFQPNSKNSKNDKVLKVSDSQSVGNTISNSDAKEDSTSDNTTTSNSNTKVDSTSDNSTISNSNAKEDSISDNATIARSKTSAENESSTKDIQNELEDREHIETFKHSVRAYGNIGVTTSQQMLKEERELVQFSIVDFVVNDFKKNFCIMVY